MGTWKEFVVSDGLFLNLWILSLSLCITILITVIIAEFPPKAEGTAAFFGIVQFAIYSLLWLLEPWLGLIQYTWDSMIAVGQTIWFYFSRAVR